MSIIVALTGVGLIAFFTMRQRLQIRTSLGRINSMIHMARNSSLAAQAPSRIVVTNVSTEQLGGAYDPEKTQAVRWRGEMVAQVSELISEWDFEARKSYSLTPPPVPAPAPLPPYSYLGTVGHLAVVNATPGSTPTPNTGPHRGKALVLDEHNAQFLRLYSYDASGFDEVTPTPTPTLNILKPIEYALKPDTRRVASAYVPRVPPPSPKPTWWDAFHRDEYRYLGRPGLGFDAWVWRDPEHSPDTSARVLLVKPQGKPDRVPPDRRVDYVIEIWPDVTPTPTPNPNPFFTANNGITDPPNAQLYACFRSMVVATDSTKTVTDAAYTGRFGIPPGEWTRVTVDWNPAAPNRMDRLSLYINGVKRTKLCAPIHYALGYVGPSPEPSPPPFLSTPPLGHTYELDYATGLPGTAVDVEPFMGTMDDVRISRVTSESTTLPDGLRFALLGDPSNPPQEVSFGWDSQGRLVGPTGQIRSEQNIIVILQNKNTIAPAIINRTANTISVSRISSFNPSEGLLAIGTLADPYDPRSRFQVNEVVRYTGTDPGGAGVGGSFLNCERGYGGSSDMTHNPPSAVFQAYLVRVGLKGEVRIDDGTK